MRLLWHIISKDARRVRWPLALWIAVMAGRYVLGAFLLRGRELDTGGLQRLVAYDNCLWALQIIWAYLLAGWIVQEDLLVDTRAFWLTRPISRLRLLGAKLLGVGVLLCVLPAAVALPWWLACGYGVRDVAAAAGETVFWFACLTAMATAVAALTDSFGRFVLYTLMLAFVASTYAMIMFALELKWSEPWLGPLEDGVGQTRVWVCAIWVLLICGIAVAHQFLTRRTWSSWILLVVGLAAIVGPVQLWPWDLSEWVKAKPREVPLVGGVTVEYVDARLWPARIESGDLGRVRFEPLLKLSGLPEPCVLSDLHLESTWRWSDEVHYSAPRAPGWNQNWGPEQNPPSLIRAWALVGLNEERLWNHASSQAFLQWIRARPGVGFRGQGWRKFPQGSCVFSVHLPASLGAKMLQQPPAWEARVEGELVRARVAALLPLRVGATGGRGADRLTILGLEQVDHSQVTMTVAQSRSTAGQLSIFDAVVVSYRDAMDLGYLAFSQDKSRVVYPWGNAFFAHRIGTVAVVRRLLTINAPTSWEGHDGRRSTWKVDSEWPGWLEHATMAKVIFDRVGRFEQTLHLDRMVVEPAAAETGEAH